MRLPLFGKSGAKTFHTNYGLGSHTFLFLVYRKRILFFSKVETRRTALLTHATDGFLYLFKMGRVLDDQKTTVRFFIISFKPVSIRSFFLISLDKGEGNCYNGGIKVTAQRRN